MQRCASGDAAISPIRWIAATTRSGLPAFDTRVAHQTGGTFRQCDEAGAILVRVLAGERSRSFDQAIDVGRPGARRHGERRSAHRTRASVHRRGPLRGSRRLRHTRGTGCRLDARRATRSKPGSAPVIRIARSRQSNGSEKSRRRPMRIAAFAGDLARAVSGTRLAKQMPGGSHDAPGSPGEGSLSYTRVRAVSAALLQDGSMYGLPAVAGRFCRGRCRGAGTGVVFLSAALPGTPLVAPVESGPNHYNAFRPPCRTFRRHS